MPSRTASCSCGQLRLTSQGEPVRISICHCLECQKRTGSVFAGQARFPRAAVTVTGNSATWSRTGESGSTATFHFCATCSAIVYWDMDAFPDFVAVPVGAFADPAFPPPTVAVYEGRQHPWTSAIGELPMERWD